MKHDPKVFISVQLFKLTLVCRFLPSFFFPFLAYIQLPILFTLSVSYFPKKVWMKLCLTKHISPLLDSCFLISPKVNCWYKNAAVLTDLLKMVTLKKPKQMKIKHSIFFICQYCQFLLFKCFLTISFKTIFWI